MIKLIVSDFDGTLIPYGEKSVCTNVKNLIYEILGRGMNFAVSSGRTYSELIRFLPEFENDIYYVCCDGAYYVKGGNVLYGRHIEKENINFIAKSTCGKPCIYHAAYKSYVQGEISEEYLMPLAPEKIDCISEIPVKEKIYKITLLSSPLRLPAHIGLRMHWNGGETDSTTQYVNRFCHKGTALSDLESRLFISGLDVAAIGDANNDIPMMRGVKYAFAVGQRSQALYDSADYRVDTAESALYKILSLK